MLLLGWVPRRLQKPWQLLSEANNGPPTPNEAGWPKGRPASLGWNLDDGWISLHPTHDALQRGTPGMAVPDRTQPRPKNGVSQCCAHALSQ